MRGIQLNADLGHLNTFALPCSAAGLCRVGSVDELQMAMDDARFRDRPKLILGGGSNVVFAGDFNGLVIQPDWRGIRITSENDDTISINAGATEVWNDLVQWSVARGLHGLENLAAIPGWCGAAPMQNIGAYGAEFADVCTAVDCIDTREGRRFTLPADECGFAYRHSIFKTGQANGWLVTGIHLTLQRKGELRMDYPGVRDALQADGIHQPGVAEMADVITRIRQRKLPDPSRLGNAGSFFKNPVVSGCTAQRLLAQYPELPHWPAGDQVKLSAAWLIEQCNWKGRREGAVGVHCHHALVLVHYSGGNGRQLLNLAERIQQDVVQRFDITLQPEPKIIQSS